MFDKISFFGMPIKTLGSLGKIRVGRVTGNTHIFFFGLTKPTMCLYDLNSSSIIHKIIHVYIAGIN